MEAGSPHAWLDQDDRLDAACFTFVTGVDLEEVVRRFGGDLRSERSATFEEAFNPYPEAQYLVFDALRAAAVVAENNGWEGSRPELAEAVSKGGRLASVYWSVNRDMAFVYAVDGVVVAFFDPLLVEQPWVGADPGSLARMCGDLSFGVGGAVADSFELVERLTGGRVAPGWLDEPHRCVTVTPLPEQPVPWGR